MKIHDIQLTTFAEAYIEAALWSSMDESDEQGGEALDQNYTFHDISEETLTAIVEDCYKFQEENADLLEESGITDEQAGHDFWLTRCGHGAGFWDRGLGEIGERLTDACRKWPNVDLYVEDGKIYA